MTKYIITALGILLLGTPVFAQNRDTVQPDSLYRKYNIRSRKTVYENSASKAAEIFLFDRQGRYSGFILTDNETGKTPQMTMHYQYNNAGVISAENDTSFRGNQYAVKVAEFSYSTAGELLKKVLKNGGNIISETSYNNDEHSETEKLYRNGNVYREQTSFYDEHHKKIRFTGTEPADKDAKPKVFEVNG